MGWRQRGRRCGAGYLGFGGTCRRLIRDKVCCDGGAWGRNGRYHVQAGVDRYVSNKMNQLTAMWGHGWADIKRLSDRPVADAETVAKCAAYLAKYVGKAYEDGGRNVVGIGTR